ncbi:MAG TPA: acyl-CoA dehydrogenase family protein [Dehalococcoidia bacterium]|nr:acyl-CoA dehydrogenase family protein [Dehalococcoidia bacterium]
MDFSFTEEQDMLRISARDFLAKECPKAKIREMDKDGRGYDPQMWHGMAELGWMGLIFPEEYGGMGANFMDLVILTEEMGRNIVAGPFFSTIALCALPLLEYGSREQKTKFLPLIAKGKAIWTIALAESSGKYDASEVKLHAVLKGTNYVLQGYKLFVTDAHVADYILVVGRTGEGKRPEDGITLFIVDAKGPNVEMEAIPTIGGDRQFKVSLDKVVVPKDNILGKVGSGWDIVDFILQRAAVLKCAEMSGACQAVLDMTSSYAKERIQFDRPIGSFQAVQHKLADMLIDAEAVQYLLYQAAWGISVGSPSPWQISAAKGKANEAYQRICIEAIATHGAIGYTMDHDIGLYYRRVKAAQFVAGDTDLHREVIARGLGL